MIDQKGKTRRVGWLVSFEGERERKEEKGVVGWPTHRHRAFDPLSKKLARSNQTTKQHNNSSVTRLSQVIEPKSKPKVQVIMLASAAVHG